MIVLGRPVHCTESDKSSLLLLQNVVEPLKKVLRQWPHEPASLTQSGEVSWNVVQKTFLIQIIPERPVYFRKVSSGRTFFSFLFFQRPAMLIFQIDAAGAVPARRL